MMRNLFIIAMAFIWSDVVMAANKSRYETSDSIFIEKILKEARNTHGISNMQLFFARKFIGRPYVPYTLEGDGEECLVVNTRELDCTTLVENVTALTLCMSRKTYLFHDFMDVLTKLRYRSGKLSGYPSRLHYFSDWIADNVSKRLVMEVQSPKPPFIAVQLLNINYMSKHPQSYKALMEHPEYVSDIALQEKKLTGKKYRYIPKSMVNNIKLLRQAVKDGDIIAITCKKAGLDIAHLGFAVWHQDGLHLLNASMIHHKVVEDPMTLYRYLHNHKSHTGIRIIRIL